MQVASDRATLCAWNPKIGAAGIKDDFELLRWRSNSNRAEV